MAAYRRGVPRSTPRRPSKVGAPCAEPVLGRPRLQRLTDQKWGELSKSHAADILVHYPDGHTTKGLEAHIAELKPQFVFAPDTRIKVHAVRIGSGEWTSVIGVMASWMKSTCSGTTAPS